MSGIRYRRHFNEPCEDCMICNLLLWTFVLILLDAKVVSSDNLLRFTKLESKMYLCAKQFISMWGRLI